MKTSWIQKLINYFITTEDGVYVDDTYGVAGTTYPIGTAGTPVDNLADALTIATARNLRKIYIKGWHTLNSSISGLEFIGISEYEARDGLDFNAQDVDFCLFRRMYIDGGTSTACLANTFDKCDLYDMILGPSGFYDCFIDTSINPHSHHFYDCYFRNVTMDSTGANTHPHFIRATGKLTITNMDTGGTWLIYGNGLDLIIAASCTTGTINIYGNVKVTNNSGGTTVNDYSVETLTDPRVMGRSQIAPTTIDLNQGIGSYDLFTGTAQVVILESLNIKMPNIVCGGALTSISIQTDDVTPGVIISAADGAVANLTAEADLGWTGTLYITVGTKIQLTIAGGAHGVAYVCQVTAKCRAVVAGGYLA